MHFRKPSQTSALESVYQPDIQDGLSESVAFLLNNEPHAHIGYTETHEWTSNNQYDQKSLAKMSSSKTNLGQDHFDFLRLLRGNTLDSEALTLVQGRFQKLQETELKIIHQILQLTEQIGTLEGELNQVIVERVNAAKKRNLPDTDPRVHFPDVKQLAQPSQDITARLERASSQVRLDDMSLSQLLNLKQMRVQVVQQQRDQIEERRSILNESNYNGTNIAALQEEVGRLEHEINTLLAQQARFSQPMSNNVANLQQDNINISDLQARNQSLRQMTLQAMTRSKPLTPAETEELYSLQNYFAKEDQYRDVLYEQILNQKQLYQQLLLENKQLRLNRIAAAPVERSSKVSSIPPDARLSNEQPTQRPYAVSEHRKFKEHDAILAEMGNLLK